MSKFNEMGGFVGLRRRGWRLAVVSGAMLPAAVLAANIVGGPGPDTLEGTPEADTLNGKGGADTMMGLAGNDTYIVAQTDDIVLEAVGDGTDTIRSTVTYRLPIYVENLTLLGNAAIDGVGNNQDNRITGNSADNALSGRGGNDRMFGLGGDDTYIVDAAGDVVNENANDGYDTVRSSVTHTLRRNVEALYLTGTAAINGTGNELANFISGNPANNVIRGLDGDDNLRGGGGNDRLIGGPGNDRLTGNGGRNIFEFDSPLDAATNVDRIVGFKAARDTIRLVGEVFPELTTAGPLPAAAFRIGVVASTTANRILYDANTGALRYDPDGSGPTAAIRFATLVDAPVLNNVNLEVVDPVQSVVNFATQIQPIFNDYCDQCHVGATAPHGLDLTTGKSYGNLVNVASDEVGSLLLVKPGDASNSYLVKKLEGTASVGARMPLGGQPLPVATIALIRNWINEGANP